MVLLSCKLKVIWALQIALLQSNIANVNTTRTPEGGPYRRETLVCRDLSTCEVQTENDYVFRYEPEHPDGDENGYVKYPGIDLQYEMDSLIEAQRSFEETEQQCAQSLDQIKN